MAHRQLNFITHEGTQYWARISKDSDTGEYRVRFYLHAVRFPDADYFTDDLKDAHGTARVALAQLALTGATPL